MQQFDLFVVGSKSQNKDRCSQIYSPPRFPFYGTGLSKLQCINIMEMMHHLKKLFNFMSASMEKSFKNISKQKWLNIT